MNLTTLFTVLGAIGSSGLFTLLYMIWNSRRMEKTSKRAEERNNRREPYIETSIQLGSAAKAMEILRQGMEELEDSKRRMREDMQDRQELLEDKIESLTNENERLRTEFFEQQCAMRDLKQEINKLRGTNECSGTTD